MAQVITSYHSTAGGSSTMYYYRYADNTSAATRIHSGEGFFLHRDYAARITNGMYLMVEPSGWIPWYYVQEIVPVYETVTDACTPPSAVTLDTASRTLIISGGAGGDLNALTGFGVSFRERAINTTSWGEWSADVFSASRTVSVSVENGMVRQYRARTMGEAGSEYFSAYAVCQTLLNGNTAAGTPVVLLPVSGMETTAPAPVIRIECPPEPDGDDMILQRSLNGGEWTDAATLGGEGGVVHDSIPAVSGMNTVRYRLMDASGETGGEDGVSFTRVSREWARSIRTGDVIANRQISFVSDIQELLERVNSLRAFYGMAAVSLPGTPGRIGDWRSQLQAMQQAVNECRASIGLAEENFGTADAWPQAAQISLLRTTIEKT